MLNDCGTRCYGHAAAEAAGQSASESSSGKASTLCPLGWMPDTWQLRYKNRMSHRILYPLPRHSRSGPRSYSQKHHLELDLTAPPAGRYPRQPCILATWHSKLHRLLSNSYKPARTLGRQQACEKTCTNLASFTSRRRYVSGVSILTCFLSGCSTEAARRSMRGAARRPIRPRISCYASRLPATLVYLDLPMVPGEPVAQNYGLL